MHRVSSYSPKQCIVALETKPACVLQSHIMHLEIRCLGLLWFKICHISNCSQSQRVGSLFLGCFQGYSEVLLGLYNYRVMYTRPGSMSDIHGVASCLSESSG